MGRYYNGDIEGKFMFAVQSSDDASFFGGTVNEPNYINYEFSKDEDMETVREGLEKCKKELGDNLEKLDKFFDTNGTYNDEILAKELKIPQKEVKHLLEWYARYKLGKKIHDYLLENDYCSFEAEL